MPTIRARFNDASVTDVKVLQMRRRRNRKIVRILQLHDCVYAGGNTWEATLTFKTPGANRKVVVRVLALDRSKNVVASITLPPRKVPK